MQKVIVTGANGQLGNEIKLLAETHTNLEFHFTDIDSLDLSDQGEVEKFIQSVAPDYLVNCAAYTAVDKAENDLINAKKLNAEVPGFLAQMATKYQYKLIHISTDYVFSGKHFTPLNENTKTNPSSVYGKTKLEGEQKVLTHADAVIIRTSWLYSAFGNNFVKSMIRLGSERKELGVVFDQVGTPTNASDLGYAILRIIQHHVNGHNWQPGIYHYSNEGVCSWFDFAVEIMHLANINCQVKPILSDAYPVPAPRPAYSVLDKKKIKDIYNLDIPYWKRSLTKTIDSLLTEK
ncbi:MAG TPA: dTDP-4-dehydrorhamnose reductase [Bacteroidales bacterium]|jgi:dTDP-4-dehydrorhamnose reductase|nr:dTDP-4-dehydrorhamnose reductase [Bacteroidales bacterium]